MKKMKIKLLFVTMALAMTSAFIVMNSGLRWSPKPKTATATAAPQARWTSTGSYGQNLNGKMFTLSWNGGGISFYAPTSPIWASTTPYPPSTNSSQRYSTTDPTTTRPYSTTDPTTTRPYSTTDPNSTRPYSTTDPNSTRLYSTTDPNSTRLYSTTDPNSTRLYSTTDPNSTRLYSTTDPNSTRLYSTTDPNSTRLYSTTDPTTTRPYSTTDPNSTRLYSTTDPNSTRLYSTTDPTTTRLYSTTDPNSTRLYSTTDPNSTRLYSTTDPTTTRPYSTTDPNSTRLYSTTDPNSTRLYSTTDPNSTRLYSTTDPTTTRPYSTTPTYPPWTSAPPSRGVSVCLRYLADVISQSTTTIFTLSPSTSPLTLQVQYSGIYVLPCGGYRALYLRPNIIFWSNNQRDLWTRVCLTVDTMKGVVQMFSGWSISVRKKLPFQYVWSGEPVINFPGFDGQLTDVQVWDYPLNYNEIYNYMNSWSSYRGSVLTWSSISYSPRGNTLLEDAFDRQAKRPISSRGKGHRPKGEKKTRASVNGGERKKGKRQQI